MEKIQIIFENLPVIIPAFCAVLALPAFAVSVITQLIKNLPLLRKIPTDALVLALSVAAGGFMYAGAVKYGIVQFSWFLLCASIIVGFFIAFVSSNGWRELYALWQRFTDDKSKKNQEENT